MNMLRARLQRLQGKAAGQQQSETAGEPLNGQTGMNESQNLSGQSDLDEPQRSKEQSSLHEPQSLNRQTGPDESQGPDGQTALDKSQSLSGQSDLEKTQRLSGQTGLNELQSLKEQSGLAEQQGLNKQSDSVNQQSVNQQADAEHQKLVIAGSYLDNDQDTDELSSSNQQADVLMPQNSAEKPNKTMSSPAKTQLTSRSSSLLRLMPLAANEPFAEKWAEMSVQLAQNEFGSFLLRSMHASGETAIGMHPFAQWQQAGHFLNAFHPELSADPSQFLFLDLETTGLGSGAGNVPFMVGLAFWEHDGFTVQQALIRHPAEERAMLAYVHHLTTGFTHLVTYNGKSFDWPLMHSRYVMNGMRQTIWQPFHIDLLHPSRAIWRNTLESCKLSHIEKMRLGIVRVDDLPGSEAPARYFQYLNEGDPHILEDVYRHNEIDMLSLATLAIRFGHLLSNRDIASVVQQPSEPEEMVRTGLWLEKMGCTHYSEQLFQLAAHIPRQRTQTLMLLAMRDKQMNNMERALRLWQTIVDTEALFVTREQAEAAIELSMYYEHKTKQLELALTYAELAKERLREMVTGGRRAGGHKQKELEQIEKRLLRLKKKCGGSV